MFKSLLFLFRAAALLALFTISQASADIVLLVHGFDSHANTWQQSGINQFLHQKGWQYQGVLNDQGPSVHLQPSGLANHQAVHKLYTVNLASRAPIEYQSSQLNKMIYWLNQVHPGEAIYLVGHSAGGLVARYTLVQLYQQQPGNERPNQIEALITIASPHLGTFRAVQAIDAVEEPFFCPGPGWRFVHSVFGGEEYDLLSKSQRLLHELYPSQPNNLIFWLNGQRHPLISYFSIIRSEGAYYGDILVPGHSQDMNNVTALKNQSFSLISHNGHFLNPQDALIIESILMLLTKKA